MSQYKTPAAELLRRLASGWTSCHHGLVDDVIHRWRTHLACHIENCQIATGSARFDVVLSNIWLRGVQEVQCLLIGGEVAEATVQISRFCHNGRWSGSLPFVLTVSEDLYHSALSVTGHGTNVVFSPSDLALILDGLDAVGVVKRCIHFQVPRVRLVPYSFILPAEGTMFVGRQPQLDRLKHEETTSFAIVGPSRIGKTSLAKHFHKQLRREGGVLAPSTRYISFYDCPVRSADEVARWFALKVANISRSQQVTAESLAGFLKFVRSTLEAPLNLILDEVDAICNWPGFNNLAMAAREASCRLVLCGKGDLLRVMLAPSSYLSNRLDLMRLEPLGEAEARTLLFQPLEDLQIHVLDAEEVAHLVLRLTGRLPHLIQFYGQKLVQRASNRLADGDCVSLDPLTVSPKDVHAVTSDMGTTGFFLSALREISQADPEVYLLALLLLREGIRRVSPSLVLRLAREEGMDSDYIGAVDICNDLVINNVLMWDQNGFCLANEGLIHHARRLGYLSTAIEDVRRTLRTSRATARVRL
jgi:hypothetical protein